MAERIHHKPAELSGGQQQRVAMARSLVNSPALLLADELTGNEDTRTSAEVMYLLCRLNRDKNQTIVLVTYEKEVGARADRIIFLRDGAVERRN